MGLFDKKSSNTTNVQETTETYSSVDNRVGGDNAIFGPTITGRNIGNVTLTDQGAVRESFNFSRDALADATGLSRDALDFAANQNANAFTFGESLANQQTIQALGAQDVLRESNRNISGLASQAFTDLTGLTGKVSDSSYGFARDVASQASGALSNAVTQIAGVVKRANESDSVEIWRIAAIGLAIVGVFYFGSKK